MENAKVLKHLFLDLEDTIITPVLDGWANTGLINIEKVLAFMEEFKPDTVHIFSFAIWNQHELVGYNQWVKPMLDEALGVTIAAAPTVDDDIVPICCSVMKLGPGSITFSDMSDFWGKQEAFRLNIRHKFKSGGTPVEVAFLDDAVYNETFSWPTLQVKGQILNIDQMKEP